jgi:DNA-3-methyladenine glycosylase I
MPERCSWAQGEELAAYHDREWGRPVTDERSLYERLSLEAFQSGLSWITILRKRDSFRRAFAGFDPELVARFGPDDVERLLGDAAIVRNRAKIEAAIANARATVGLREEEGLSAFVWSFAAGSEPARGSLVELPSATPESSALAKALRARGFRFLGPTTVYALMQACGLVNDHVEGCFVRDEVEREQAGARAAVSGV